MIVSVCCIILGNSLVSTLDDFPYYRIVSVLHILNLCYVVYASYSLYRLSIKVYPEKSKADPTSMNYLEQWLSYSDEAEKELTY